jgi:hypothetical protein
MAPTSRRATTRRAAHPSLPDRRAARHRAQSLAGSIAIGRIIVTNPLVMLGTDSRLSGSTTRRLGHCVSIFQIVMAALVAAIHVFPSELRLPLPASSVGQKVVDGRHKAGHDDRG